MCGIKKTVSKFINHKTIPLESTQDLIIYQSILTNALNIQRLNGGKKITINFEKKDELPR